MNELEIRTYKVGLIGERDSGTTEFVSKYCQKLSGEEYEDSLGIGHYVKRLELTAENCYIQVCMQGSEPRFNHLLPTYLKGSCGTIIFFNLFDPNAFSRIPEWVYIIESSTINHPILLVGNNPKATDYQQLKSKEFMEFVKANHFAMYLDISINSGKNINLMFQTLLDLISEGFDLTTWKIINKFTWYDTKGYPHFDPILEIMTNEEQDRIFNAYHPEIHCKYCYIKFHCPSYGNIHSCETQDWITSKDYLDAEREHKRNVRGDYLL